MRLTRLRKDKNQIQGSFVNTKMRYKRFYFFWTKEEKTKKKELGKGHFHENYEKTSIWMQNERTRRGVLIGTWELQD